MKHTVASTLFVFLGLFATQLSAQLTTRPTTRNSLSGYADSKMKLTEEVKLLLQNGPSRHSASIEALAVSAEDHLGLIETTDINKHQLRFLSPTYSGKATISLPAAFNDSSRFWLVCSSANEWIVLGNREQGLTAASYNSKTSAFDTPRIIAQGNCVDAAEAKDGGFVLLVAYSRGAGVECELRAYGRTLRLENRTVISNPRDKALVFTSLVSLSNGNSIALAPLADRAIEYFPDGSPARIFDLHEARARIPNGRLGRIWVRGGDSAQSFVSVSDNANNWLVPVSSQMTHSEAALLSTPLSLFFPRAVYVSGVTDSIYYSDGTTVGKIHHKKIELDTYSSFHRDEIKIGGAILTNNNKLVILDTAKNQLLVFPSLREQARKLSLSSCSEAGGKLDTDSLAASGNDEVVFGYKSPQGEVGVVRVNLVDGSTRQLPTPELHNTCKCFFCPPQSAIWGVCIDGLSLLKKGKEQYLVSNWSRDPVASVITTVLPNSGSSMGIVVEEFRQGLTGLDISRRELLIASNSDVEPMRIAFKNRLINGYIDKLGNTVLNCKGEILLIRPGADRVLRLILGAEFTSNKADQWFLLPNESDDLWILCGATMTVKCFLASK